MLNETINIKDMNNMKQKILSLLVLLVTAASGAWAQTETYAVKFEANGNSLTREVTLPHKFSCNYDSEKDELDMIIKELYGIRGFDAEVAPTATGSDKVTTGKTGKSQWIQIDAPFDGTVTVNGKYKKYVGTSAEAFDYSLEISLPVTVNWNASTKTGTFSMPGSDLVLTPRYASATIYQTDGVTEKQAYETLKEAIQNVQNGETIVLDWDVTFTAQDEPATTKTTQGGVKFTIDFNGHTIDGLALGTGGCIILNNEGDEITFIDSSTNQADQAGGLKGVVNRGNVDDVKVIFDGGCYNFGDNSFTAAMLNDLYSGSNTICNLADGKEFVDIENAAADGFRYYVGYKAFELTIGPQKFATFYAEQNVQLEQGEVGFYTIGSVNPERTTATLGRINSTISNDIIPAGTPILVYNGGNAEQTVKLKVTASNGGLTVLHAPEFQGTAKAKEFTADDMLAADYYALSGGQFFVPVLDAGTIGKNRCWLQFDHQPQQPGARTIRLVFGETTGVSEVIEVNEVSDDTLYDLNGRRVAKPARKGVYIQSGKKVVR